MSDPTPLFMFAFYIPAVIVLLVVVVRRDNKRETQRTARTVSRITPFVTARSQHVEAWTDHNHKGANP